MSALDAWTITRYLDKVAAGDEIALWRAGPDAGVVALGQVTGPPIEHAGPADHYWEDREKADRTRWSLPVRLSEVFTDIPVARDELRHDPQFVHAAILQQPFAGNPFPLTDGEWRAILNRHRGSGPDDGPEPDVGWSLLPGATIRRSELHDATAAAAKTASAPPARPRTS